MVPATAALLCPARRAAQNTAPVSFVHAHHGMARDGRGGAAAAAARRGPALGVGVAVVLAGVVARATAAAAAAGTWTNWDGQQSCTPASVVNVTTVADAVAAVTAAGGAAIRVAGFGHSFSAIDVTAGVMINVVPPAAVVDAVTVVAAGVVQVHAGLHLWQLNDALAAVGLAMPNLGAIANQTVAGAVSTNTHGTGPTGGLSTFLVGVTLVAPNGTVVNASASRNADVFAAARTGYGVFGVLVWVQLAVWPAWTMELIQAPWDLAALLPALPALTAQYERLQWYYTPYTRNATVVIRANTTAPVTGCWNPVGPPPPAPVTPPPAGMAAWPAGTTSCVDASYKTLTHNGDDAQRYTEMEMMVPAEAAVALATDVLAYQDAVRARHNASVQLFTGMRYVAADDITLSPFAGRATAVLSMIVFGNATYGGDPAEVALYDVGIQDIAFRRYAARPHPGKVNWFTADMMAAVYGADALAAFHAARAAVDAAGVMMNNYTTTLLGW